MDGGSPLTLLQSTYCDDNKDLWFSYVFLDIYTNILAWNVFSLALCHPRIIQKGFLGGDNSSITLTLPVDHTFSENWICPTAASGHLKVQRVHQAAVEDLGSSSSLRPPWGRTGGKDSLISVPTNLKTSQSVDFSYFNTVTFVAMQNFKS